MVRPNIQDVYIEKSVRNAPITRRVLERLDGRPRIEFVEDGRAIVEAHRQSEGSLNKSKRTLLLHDFRGEAIKPCPGTLNYICCQYQILNFGTGCPLDCSYCILQDYFSNPLLTVQANSDAFLKAAAATLSSHPDEFYRLGTGEFADSLALEPLTGYAPILIEFIRDHPNAVLELKSKAVWIDNILNLDHGGRTVCAWSLNAPEIMRAEEHRTASLEERLRAAARCEQAGYRLAFHFDPIFHFDGWREGYAETVRRLFETVRPESINWISLGCFRYRPGLERIIRERFPRNLTTYGEFVLAGDKKMRYPQPLRIAIYREILKCIRKAGGSNVLVYFCMENHRVWESVMGRAPRDNDELGRRLDASCTG